MNYCKFIFTLIIVMTTGITTSAQFSLDRFLAQAKSDISMVNYQRKSEFLSSNPYRSPWIQRTEFRTRTNDFNFSPDEYRFRLGPTNPFEVRANNKYYQMELDYMLSEYQTGLNQALEERYQMIIDLLELYNLKELKINQLSILDNEINYYRTLATNPGFRVDDYIESIEDRIEKKLELNAVQHDIRIILKKIRHKYPFEGNIEPDAFDLVAVEEIQSRLRGINETENEMRNDLFVDNLQQELRVEEQRIKVEKAENNRNIGFIQAEFDPESGNEFDEHLGFQVGIRLPLTNPDRPDLNRRKLEFIDDEVEMQETKSEIVMQRDLISLDIAFLMDQYKNFTEEEYETKLLQVSNDNNGHDPIDIIKINKTALRISRMKMEVKWQIYRTYIDYLFYTGRLVEPPLKNYLSGTVRVIEE